MSWTLLIEALGAPFLAAWVWREPAWFLLLLALPLVFFLRRRYGRSALLFAPYRLIDPRGAADAAADATRVSAVFGDGALPPSLRTRLAWVPTACLMLGLAGIAASLARPAEPMALPDAHEGIDILLCLDVSSSMQVSDGGGRPPRLVLAREAAARFVRARPRDRIGLLAFARYADLRCPPTTDHDALLGILDDTEAVRGDSAEDRTGLGAAVAQAAAVLSRSSGTSRVVVLLTDGLETVAVEGADGQIAPLHGAQLAERFGVRIHAIAMGKAAASSGPDATLPIVSARTGGRFHTATDEASLSAVYASIDAMERHRIELPRRVLRDVGMPIALGALALLSLWGLLAVAGWEGRP